MKTCSRCQYVKPSNDYTKDRSTNDGLNRICRVCTNDNNAASYQRHKHRWYDKYHKGGGKEKYAKRYRNNPRYRQMVSRVSSARRKSMCYGVDETFTVDDFEIVFARFANKCFNCGTQDRDLQVDHHIPKHLGVPLSHTNAVILCDTCNGSKGRCMPHEFYTEQQLALLDTLGVVSHTECPE